MEFYQESARGVLRHFHADANTGLSSKEVAHRTELYGLNELQKKKKKNPIILFLNQFRSFIIYILLFALVISIIAGEVSDAITIIVILIFNAVFGFVQEYKAEKAIDALKKMSALQSRVLRNGKEHDIPAKNLVPGDIILLEEGNSVPADARLIDIKGLQVGEAALTGESVPVSKQEKQFPEDTPLAQRKNMVFSGTAITRGRATAVVTGTGMHTEIGKIAGMLSQVKDEQTPLQKKLEKFGSYLGVATVVICIIVFFLRIFNTNTWHILLEEGLLPFVVASKESFLIAVTLAVAAVPEGLPAIVTITLAIGVQRMVKRHSLIRRLPSVETLGETTVICSDKTGTITRNQMSVKRAYVNSTKITLTEDEHTHEGTIEPANATKNNTAKLLFEIGNLCNDASIQSNGKARGDPTEIALLYSARTTNTNQTDEWKRTAEEPFDSLRKMMSVVVEKGKKKFLYTKGAPESVLAKCTKVVENGKVTNLTPKKRKQILEANKKYASEALRVLGFAYKPQTGTKITEKDLIFVGMQAMRDPPHEEVPEAIRRCHQAGIRVVMITGDNIHTAKAIANEVGIVGDAMQGAEFGKLSEAEQQKVLETTSIFARVEPAHKMLIVELMQKRGNIVAMTGDGVNDAPALKKANLGVAMGIAGTDVAKETSDMVLQDDNFTSIVNAVEEGRSIFENIRKFINYLLSCNLGEVLIVFFAILFGWPAPITPTMLLWLNLVTDGLPALALGVDPNPKDLMKKPPRRAAEGIMSKNLAIHIGVVSVLITIAVLGIFWYGLQKGYNTAHLQTVAFTAIIVMELVRLHTIRREQKLSVFSNKWLIGAVSTSLLLQLVVIYTEIGNSIFKTVPLTGFDWLLILGASVAVYIVNILISPLIDKKHPIEASSTSSPRVANI